MLFNIFLGIILVLFIGCQETISNPKEILSDDQVDRIDQFIDIEKELPEYLSETINPVELSDLSKMDQNINILFNKIFVKDFQNSEAYLTPESSEHLRMFSELMSLKIQDKKTADIAENLEHIDDKILSPCLVWGKSQCHFLSSAVSKAKEFTNIIVHIGLSKESSLETMGYLGLAINLSEGSFLPSAVIDDQLLDIYLKESIEEIQNSGLKMQSRFFVQRTVNAIDFLVKSTDWTYFSKDNAKTLVALEPWKPWESDDILGRTKSHVLPFISIFAENDDNIFNAFEESVLKMEKDLFADSYSLEDKPAFKNIQIEKFTKESASVRFFVIQLIRGSLTGPSARQFYTQQKQRGFFLTRVFRAVRIFSRWKIAQLSIRSSKKLAEDLFKSPIGNGNDFEAFLRNSESLGREWNFFLQTQLLPLQTFLTNNIGIQNQQLSDRAERFFSALDLNILKLAVYPNMMATAYKIAENRVHWKQDILISGQTEAIDTSEMFDKLFTGHYKKPWFNFIKTGSSDVGSRRFDSKEIQTALLGPEVLDAFYYFFATETHKIYNIDPDKFISQLGEEVMKHRWMFLEKHQELLSHSFKNQSSNTNRFISWCRNVQESSSEREFETLDFYNLFKRLTPFTPANQIGRTIRSSDIEDEKIKDQQNRIVFFFNDVYQINSSESRGSSSGKAIKFSLGESMDRIKIEIDPFLKNLKKMIKIVEKLEDQKEIHNKDQTENRQQAPSKLTLSKELVKEIESKVQKLWGAIFQLENRFDNCLEVTLNVARQRAGKIVSMESYYTQHIVWPLMQKVAKGEISDVDATEELKRIQKYPGSFKDSIAKIGSNRAKYTVHKLSLAFRIKQYFESGININDHPLVGTHNLDAIVGNRVSIVPPPNFAKYSFDHPYLSEKGLNFLTFSSLKSDISGNGSQFTQDVTVSLFDKKESTDENDHRWTQWSAAEDSTLSNTLYSKLEYYSQLYMASPVTYSSSSEIECGEKAENSANDLCVRDFDIYDLADKVIALFSTLEIKDEYGEYLQKTRNFSYVNSDSDQAFISFEKPLYRRLLSDEDRSTTFHHLDYEGLAGIFDTPLRMMHQSQKLGILYRSEKEAFQYGEEVQLTRCRLRGVPCFWEDDKSAALEHFYARRNREIFIFNFDREHLNSDFLSMKKRIHKRLGFAKTVDEQGEQALEQALGDTRSDGISIDLRRDPYKFITLSQKLLPIKRQAERFFTDETQSYFLQDHTQFDNAFDWD